MLYFRASVLHFGKESGEMFPFKGDVIYIL